MIPWAHIRALQQRCYELKEAGDHAAVIPLANDIVRVLESHGVHGKELANALNRVVCANIELQQYRAAEVDARHALSSYIEWEERMDLDQTLATHLWVLHTVLALQGKYSEAVPYGEKALEIFSAALGADYHFVQRRLEELSETRSQTWKG